MTTNLRTHGNRFFETVPKNFEEPTRINSNNCLENLREEDEEESEVSCRTTNQTTSFTKQLRKEPALPLLKKQQFSRLDTIPEKPKDLSLESLFIKV